jgi:hypothetical protein
MLTRIAQAIAGATIALAAFAAHAEPVVVKNLDMFVDPPTGFVFVKMPQGWKFVGQLDAQAMRALPAGVHTSLLTPDADDDMSRMARPANGKAESERG